MRRSLRDGLEEYQIRELSEMIKNPIGMKRGDSNSSCSSSSICFCKSTSGSIAYRLIFVGANSGKSSYRGVNFKCITGRAKWLAHVSGTAITTALSIAVH